MVFRSISPRSVFAADLDGDGDQDLVVANNSANDVSVLKNNGDGTFVAEDVNYGAGRWSNSAIAADLDGDGDKDLAVANSGSNNVSILFNLTKSPNDVQDIKRPELPSRFALSQNYPNPFNPETKIQFSMPRASTVKIDIFNLLGQTVRSLVDQYLAAGNYVRTWNGTDNQGRSVATGVYFYRFTAGDIVEAKKMVLLK